MTTIFYETFPVARLTFNNEWRLDYDPSWKERRSAFPVSLTMPLRSGPVTAERLLPWLANLLPETHLAEIGQRLKVSPPRTSSACSVTSGGTRPAHCRLVSPVSRVFISSLCRMLGHWNASWTSFPQNPSSLENAASP